MEIAWKMFTMFEDVWRPSSKHEEHNMLMLRPNGTCEMGASSSSDAASDSSEACEPSSSSESSSGCSLWAWASACNKLSARSMHACTTNSGGSSVGKTISGRSVGSSSSLSATSGLMGLASMMGTGERGRGGASPRKVVARRLRRWGGSGILRRLSYHYATGYLKKLWTCWRNLKKIMPVCQFEHRGVMLILNSFGHRKHLLTKVHKHAVSCNIHTWSMMSSMHPPSTTLGKRTIL